jgi:hypothetical protein
MELRGKQRGRAWRTRRARGVRAQVTLSAVARVSQVPPRSAAGAAACHASGRQARVRGTRLYPLAAVSEPTAGRAAE